MLLPLVLCLLFQIPLEIHFLEDNPFWHPVDPDTVVPIWNKNPELYVPLIVMAFYLLFLLGCPFDLFLN